MTKQTLHSRDLNLLPLRTVLLTAERDVPSRVPFRNLDERLAFQLIEKIKAAPAMPNPFEGLTVESPRPIPHATIRDMAESHV